MRERLERAMDRSTPAGDAGQPSARRIWVDLLLYPTHTIPTAVAPVLVGCGLALRDGVFSPWPALVGFLGSWGIHLAGVFTDNHELLRRNPEVIEHPELTRAVRDGTLRLGTLRLAIAGCLAVALAAAPWLYRIGGWPVIAFGLVGTVVSVSYNGGPWAYVRRGHADPIFLLMFWVVAVPATYYIQLADVRGAAAPWETFRGMPLAVFFAGFPCGAIVTSVMLIDDIRDRAFDAAKGWRTGTVRFGDRFTRAEITVLVALAYAAPILFATALDLGAGALLPLASAPLALSVVRAVRRSRELRELQPLTPAMARLATVHSLLLAIGVAL